MRLLYNNMLSDKLIAQLADIYPDSLHIKNIGPENVPDTEVWSYAREHGLTIVTKDRDYREISQARGHPPKVFLITLPNCSTAQIASLLRQHHADLASLQQADEKALLEVDPPGA